MFSLMDPRMTVLERAFQLARSGEVSGLPEIRKILKREGYNRDQIEGRALTRQLTDLIKAAHACAPSTLVAVRVSDTSR
jgi:hypothetical protein